VLRPPWGRYRAVTVPLRIPPPVGAWVMHLFLLFINTKIQIPERYKTNPKSRVAEICKKIKTRVKIPKMKIEFCKIDLGVGYGREHSDARLKGNEEGLD
jgi:hypothetical protein